MKILVLALLAALLASCATIPPASCDQVVAQLERDRETLEMAGVAVDGACAVSTASACEKAMRFLTAAKRAHDRAQILVDIFCPALSSAAPSRLV